MPSVLLPLSRLWGYSGLSPKLLAGMLNFGNGLKAELKEEFLVSVVDSEWEGKANQLEEEGEIPQDQMLLIPRKRA